MRIALFCLALCAVIFITTHTAEAAVQTRTVAYDANGTACEGYLAWDDSTGGSRPGILVVHQWLGLTDYEKQRCEMLAELGFTAFSCDVYGVEGRPAGRENAGAVAGKYRSDVPLFRERLQAGLDALRRQPEVDAGKVAAIGYCFGGGGVLEMARAGMDLAGVVSFHGSLTTTLPAQPGMVKAKVLVCHGADDPHAAMETRNALEAEMRSAGADCTIVSYSGAVHSFTDWNANMPGQAEYNAQADHRSWQAMLDFFDELFD
jgi:dienelactone hydrolase